MRCNFYKGFSVWEEGFDDTVICTPHSGPALDNTTSRDDNSDTVASLLFKRTLGRLVVSNMPRKRLYGVDFNRDIPPPKEAISMFPYYEQRKYNKKLYNFISRYAFVAYDNTDYENRLKIYQNFWGEVSGAKYVVLIHRAFPRIKALPSIMDVVTFRGGGYKKKKILEIVEEVNSKYYNFLKSVENDYKKMILFEQERVLNNVISVYGSLSIKKMNVEIKEFFLKDLEKIKEYSKKEKYEGLVQEFTPQNFLDACRSALENAPFPKITIENAFKGDLAYGVKRKLLPIGDKQILEIEPSRFLNFWHPDTTAEIIHFILNKIKNI